MTLDLVPRRLLSFPSLPSIWEDDDNWLTMPSTQTGLSVSEDEKNVYVEAAVPGIDPENIEVNYQDGYVWIHGETNDEQKDKNRKYYRQNAQSFSYRVAVPGDIDQNAEPEATYKNGMMVVTFAKSPQSQPKKIKVKNIGNGSQKQLK
jgi:HSP20 family protein